jgi:hypothetical protein
MSWFEIIICIELGWLVFTLEWQLGHWFSLMGTAKFRGFVGKLG